MHNVPLEKRCQRLQAGEPGERASRQLRSALLCLCNGKNPLGDAQEKYQVTLPQHGGAGPGRPWMGRARARDGAMAARTFRPLAPLRIGPSVGRNRALHPHHHGPQGGEALRRDTGSPVRFCTCRSREPASLPLGGENRGCRGEISKSGQEEFPSVELQSAPL